MLTALNLGNIKGCLSAQPAVVTASGYGNSWNSAML